MNHEHVNGNKEIDLKWTGERFLPWMKVGEIHYEHLHRYYFAKRFVKHKEVLDLGCGEGYGCSILLQDANSVTGIDKDEETIHHAKKKYAQDNIEFLTGSITQIPIEGEAIFDVITCFEVLEHIEDQEKLLKEVKRLLKPSGIFIVSTPNKTAFTDEERSPFHKKELELSEFKKLLQTEFKETEFFYQSLFLTSNIWKDQSSRIQEYVIERRNSEFQVGNKRENISKFFLSIATDSKLEKDSNYESYLIDSKNELLKNKDIYLEEISKLIQTKDLELNKAAKYADELGVVVKQRDSKVIELEEINGHHLVEHKKLNQSLWNTHEELIDVKNELTEIKSSVIFRTFKKLIKMMDMGFPTNTKRGEVKNIFVSSLAMISDEGLGNYFSAAKTKIDRKEYKILTPIKSSEIEENLLYNKVKANDKKRLKIVSHSQEELKGDNFVINENDDLE